MSYGSSVAVGRPVTTQTTSALSLRTSTPKVVYPSARQVTSQRCCDNGRPLMMDPVTGGTICSCQLKSGLPAYLSRVPSLPETMYSAAYNQLPQTFTMGTDTPTAFYPLGMKPDRTADGLKLAPSGMHAPYYLDHVIASHPYNTFYPGFDLNSARRKNATRETTSALKAWLYEHRKNPYPTKGEKIMLAIITRMTLTQVSTWFANARRRLKKESKMDDKDEGDLVDLDDIDVNDTSEKSTDGGHTSADLSDISDAEDSSPHTLSTQSCIQRLHSQERGVDSAEKLCGVSHSNRSKVKDLSNSYSSRKSASTSTVTLGLMPHDLETNRCAESRNGDVVKPKIWSISEIISSKKDCE